MIISAAGTRLTHRLSSSVVCKGSSHQSFPPLVTAKGNVLAIESQERLENGHCPKV